LKNFQIFKGGSIMNKTELIAGMAEKTGLTKKDAEKALSGFVDVVTEELIKGGKVQLVGFGTFDTAERAAREGRNPQTGAPMPIAASKAVKFSVGKSLKDAVNNK
jgi:DNA-binding protein HU-beta